MRKFTHAVLLTVFVTAFLTRTPPATAAYYNEGNDGLTEATAYVIDSAQDLQDLKSRVEEGIEYPGRYYKQTTNITTPGPKIGTETRPFRGHYLAGRHTITISDNNPIFNFIKTDGVAVKYLDVRAGDIRDNVFYHDSNSLGTLANVFRVLYPFSFVSLFQIIFPVSLFL